MRQRTLNLDPVKAAIESLDAPKLVKALLLSLHQRGGEIDLKAYLARFDERQAALIKRTVCGAVRRGFATRNGRSLTLSQTVTSGRSFPQLVKGA